MPLLSLADREARLTYVATVYHLGRPGSEVDATTLERHEYGLEPLHAALAAYATGSGPPAAHARVDIEVSAFQLRRLGEALLGLVNELKQIDIAGGRSAVPGLPEALAQVARLDGHHGSDGSAPDVTPSALDLVAEVMALRRRLSGALDAAEAELARQIEAAQAERQAARPWWRRWGRRDH